MDEFIESPEFFPAEVNTKVDVIIKPPPDNGPVARYLINGNFPSIIDLITQHLELAELLELSQLNSEYDAIILDRITFVVSPQSQHFEVVTDTEDEDDDFKFLKPAVRRYRHIKFKSCDLSTLDNIVDFLTDELQSLKCHDCRCTSLVKNKELEELNLEKLKRMDISLTPYNHVILSILKKSINLKELSLTQSTDEVMYLNELMRKDYKFKLTMFKFSVFTDYNFRMRKPELTNIIQKHGQTLVELVLDVWVDTTVMKLCFMLPKLYRLEFYEMAKWNRGPESEVNWRAVLLPKSLTIEVLKVQDLNNDVNLLGLLLGACPRLRILILSRITTRTIHSIQTARKKKLSKNLIICDEFHEALTNRN